MKAILDWIDDDRNTQKTWAYSALLMGVFYLGQAILKQRWLIGSWPRPTLIAAALGIAFALCALLNKQSWAGWLGAGWLLFWTIGLAINAALSGWRGSDVLLALVMAGMAFGFYFAFFRPRVEDADED